MTKSTPEMIAERREEIINAQDADRLGDDDWSAQMEQLRRKKLST